MCRSVSGSSGWQGLRHSTQRVFFLCEPRRPIATLGQGSNRRVFWEVWGSAVLYSIFQYVLWLWFGYGSALGAHDVHIALHEPGELRAFSWALGCNLRGSRSLGPDCSTAQPWHLLLLLPDPPDTLDTVIGSDHRMDGSSVSFKRRSSISVRVQDLNAVLCHRPTLVIVGSLWLLAAYLAWCAIWQGNSWLAQCL